MQLCDVYQGLGESVFRELLASISIGKLRTYQLYERMKLRFRVNKLNTESLARSAPRQLERIAVERDEAFAAEVGQTILVCHLDVVIGVLNFLEIPHQEGFFEKDAEIAKYLTGDWQQRAWDAHEKSMPKAVLVFYLNHLAAEMTPDLPLFNPLAQAGK